MILWRKKLPVRKVWKDGRKSYYRKESQAKPWKVTCILWLASLLLNSNHWLGAFFSKGWPSYCQNRQLCSKNLIPSPIKRKSQKLKTSLKEFSPATGTGGKTEERTLKTKAQIPFHFWHLHSRQEHTWWHEMTNRRKIRHLTLPRTKCSFGKWSESQFTLCLENTRLASFPKQFKYLKNEWVLLRLFHLAVFFFALQFILLSM